MKKLTVMFMLVLLVAASPVAGVEYFVSNVGGSDSNSGLSSNTPFASFAKVNSLVNPGDVIHIMNTGQAYHESFNAIRPGTEEQRIVVEGHGSTIDGQDSIRVCFFIETSYWHIKDLICIRADVDAFSSWGDCVGHIYENIEGAYSFDDGFTMHQNGNATVINGKFHHNMSGIQDIHETVTTYINCLVYSNREVGINVAGKQHVIRNCRAWHNYEHYGWKGYDYVAEAGEVLIENCESYDTPNGIEIRNSATCTVERSVVHGSIDRVLMVESTANYNGDYNLFGSDTISIDGGATISTLSNLQAALNTDWNSEVRTSMATEGPWYIDGIQVGPLPLVNGVPVVDAGTDQTLTLPFNQATLDGTVSDDGLPTNGTLTVQWSKVSGTGTVVFGSATVVDATATFPTNGIYVLRLTATDGAATNSDTVTVTVNPRDVTPPSVTGAEVLDGTHVRVSFSEPLLADTATNTANYALDQGVSVLGASLDGQNIALAVSSLTDGQTYVVTINNVMDLSSNAVAPGTTTAFTYHAPVMTTLTAVADTRIRPIAPDNNFGAYTWLKCQSGDSETLMRFDLTQAGGTITAGVLTLTLDQNVSGTLEGTVYRLHNQNDAWQESGATWNHRQTPATAWYSGGSFDVTADTYNTAIGSYSLSSGSAGSTLDIALDGATLEAMRTNGNAGIHLDPTTLNGLYVRSSEHGTAADRPQLTLYFEAAQAPDPDGDSDGMDDSWEQQHFGDTSTATTNSDSDADGMLDWQEFVAGSQPTNSGSIFEIGSASQLNGNVIQWAAVTGCLYSIFWNTNMNDVTLSLISNLSAVGNGSLSFTDTLHSTEKRLFYKISVQR